MEGNEINFGDVSDVKEKEEEKESMMMMMISCDENKNQEKESCQLIDNSRDEK